MNVFDLDRALVSDYERFARSFTQIRAPDIRAQVEQIYATDRFWPEPLISINPHFERAPRSRSLRRRDHCTRHGPRLPRRRAADPVHRHQAQAIAKAAQRQSFVVTTGTGSGKSLCFFMPIIDAAIRARAAGEARAHARHRHLSDERARQQPDARSSRSSSSNPGLPDRLRPTFARYTGQESQEERERIREAKPDILLTNFMMLELLMTRQNELDRAVIANAQGLDFIVLDELHTYRGRQGADVAMLVRRVRDRLCPEHDPICIGTSATMASEGDEAERAAAVAAVASRLFGTTIPADAVIDESLERATDPSLKPATLGAAARGRRRRRPCLTSLMTMRCVAIRWRSGSSSRSGFRTGSGCRAASPSPSRRLPSGWPSRPAATKPVAGSQLQAMLMLMSRPASERGGAGDRAFMAFKLHRFISGAGHVYATLRGAGQRRVTLDGQRFDPEDPDARLYATFFCRNCGQEHHPVVSRRGGRRTARAARATSTRRRSTIRTRRRSRAT